MNTSCTHAHIDLADPREFLACCISIPKNDQLVNGSVHLKLAIWRRWLILMVTFIGYFGDKQRLLLTVYDHHKLETDRLTRTRRRFVIVSTDECLNLAPFPGGGPEREAA